MHPGQKVKNHLIVSDSYKDDEGNQATNKTVLQNASMSTTYDVNAIFEEYTIEPPVTEFN
jgi:hypothetical protein